MNSAAYLGVSKTLAPIRQTFTGLDYKSMYACILLDVESAVKAKVLK